MTLDLMPDGDHEPHHETSPTGRFIYEMQLYGYRPFQEEPDGRPLPDEQTLEAGLTEVFSILAGLLEDTRLEPDLDGLLWSATNLFHRAAERIVRDLDKNEQSQRVSQREQDGSEVKSVELERMTAEGITLIERRNAFEYMRDVAGELYQSHTGSHWRPRAGSLVNRKTMTAAVIDSRDFISARRRAETEVMLPTGTKIAFSGGTDYNDHEVVWDALDRALARFPDMILLHGGSTKGAERIAACWAASRGVTEIPFKPNFARYSRKEAPFKRNDTLLETMPSGVIVFPGGGIQGNITDKARGMGIPVWRFPQGGA